MTNVDQSAATPNPTNGVGVFGLTLALISFLAEILMTMGHPLPPFGLIEWTIAAGVSFAVSAAGMLRRPRALGIAGAVVGFFAFAIGCGIFGKMR